MHKCTSESNKTMPQELPSVLSRAQNIGNKNACFYTHQSSTVPRADATALSSRFKDAWRGTNLSVGKKLIMSILWVL